jgi:hypothetical protein
MSAKPENRFSSEVLLLLHHQSFWTLHFVNKKVFPARRNKFDPCRPVTLLDIKKKRGHGNYNFMCIRILSEQFVFDRI